MRIEFGFPASRSSRPTVLTIGNFDGIHRGHLALIDEAVVAGHRLGAEAVVLTFDPHPRCLLDPENCPPALTTLDEKRELIAARGIDRLVVLEFTPELSGVTAENFCARLEAGFDLRQMVVGQDFALGHQREGDVSFLRARGVAHGWGLTAVPAVTEGGEAVSSSRVRKALRQGDLAAATRLLGHPHYLDARVEHGDQVGSTIGYPTANLAITPNKCLPARGVYSTWIRLSDGWHMAATNVGYRPTFGGDHLTVEAFVLDFDGDLYDQRVRTAFISHLRDEVAYPDTASLTAQIAVDVEQTRRELGAARPPED